MQPYKIDIYVYADSAEEAQQVSSTWRTFVLNMRDKGIAVHANKLSKALKDFGNNPLVSNFLR